MKADEVDHDTHEDAYGPYCCSKCGIHAPSLHRKCILR